MAASVCVLCAPNWLSGNWTEKLGYNLLDDELHEIYCLQTHRLLFQMFMSFIKRSDTVQYAFYLL